MASDTQEKREKREKKGGSLLAVGVFYIGLLTYGPFIEGEEKKKKRNREALIRFPFISPSVSG